MTWPIAGRRVLVTGSEGFLGTALRRRLLVSCPGVELVRTGRRSTSNGMIICDLTRAAAAEALVRNVAPDAVVHLAAACGGIGANLRSPATFFLDNLQMGVNVLRACAGTRRRDGGPVRLLVVGTVCGYPLVPPRIPFHEADVWEGYPEATNAPYGIAKRTVCEGVTILHAAGLLDGVVVYPTNLYGPGDDFDPETSHVIPAMIRKFEEARVAGWKAVELWGTGKASRDFLYVDDAAEGIAAALEHAPDASPINLGSGTEVTIRDLAAAVMDVVGWTGDLEWDETKPDGQPRRVLETSQARERLGWTATTSLGAGLRRTVDWWRGRIAGWSEGSMPV